MKDKVLQRKMFREKALKKYGGDMLPKFNESGLMEGEKTEVDQTQDTANPLNILLQNLFGDDTNSVSVPYNYNPKQQMLLSVAGRLLQAQQRPGESMFSGVGRGVGKAITEDFPVIQKLDLTSRAASSKKSGPVNKTKVFDTIDRETKEVSFAEYDADQKSKNPRYMIGEEKTYSIGIEGSAFGDKGRLITLDPVQIRQLKSKLGNNFSIIFRPKGERDRQAEMEDFYTEKQFEKDLELKTEATTKLDELVSKNTQVLDISDKVIQNLEGLGNVALEGDKAIAGFVGDVLYNVNSFIGGAEAAFEVFGADPTESVNVEKDKALEFMKSTNQADDIQDYLEKLAETESGKRRFGQDQISRSTLERFAGLSAENKTLIIELAYSIAKSREEGGRFSVSDIELAMASIGNTSDRKMAKIQLRAIQYTRSSAVTAQIKTDPRFKKFFVGTRGNAKKEKAAFDKVLDVAPEVSPFVNIYLAYRYPKVYGPDAKPINKESRGIGKKENKDNDEQDK
jgi:hypothetical protein